MSPNPNSTGGWSIVSRRRRGGGGGANHRHKPPIPQSETLILPTDPPPPWSPSDPDPDPDPQRESRLLKRMQSSIHRLESSRFYRRFLSRLRDPQIRDGLARILALASGSEIQMVVYGIGSIESYCSPRLQLALAVLLRRDLGCTIGSVEVFDPVLSAAECAVVEALGCAVIRRDEQGRRSAAVPTIFYMPHCEAILYDNLLEANWRPVALNRIVVLGNSFGVYARYVEEMTGCRGSVAMGEATQHVLGVRKYVREVAVDGGKKTGSSGEGGDDDDGNDDDTVDDDDGYFRAFRDMSWHFFELDDDAEMNL